MFSSVGMDITILFIAVAADSSVLSISHSSISFEDDDVEENTLENQDPKDVFRLCVFSVGDSFGDSVEGNEESCLLLKTSRFSAACINNISASRCSITISSSFVITTFGFFFFTLRFLRCCGTVRFQIMVFLRKFRNLILSVFRRIVRTEKSNVERSERIEY